MNLNVDLKTLTKVVEGEGSLNLSFLVSDVTSLQRAGEYDVVFIFDPEDNSVFPQLTLDEIKNCKAGVIVASKPWVEGKSYIIVNDPLRALHRVEAFSQWQKREKNEKDIHETAIIETSATIGQNAKIGAHVYIGKECVVGDNVKIYPGAKILDRCIIGNNVIIYAGVVIGSDGFGYRAMKTGLYKIPQIGIVRIGDHVEIGANTTIDRAAFEETVIGDGCKIDNLVQIAHNVIIGKSCVILAQTGIAGSVKIGMGCQIGGQVAIRDHITIGNGVKIVSKSAVMNNVKDGEVLAGAPAIPFTQWKRLTVALFKLPELVKLAKVIQRQQESKGKGFSFWKRILGFYKK